MAARVAIGAVLASQTLRNKLYLSTAMHMDTHDGDAHDSQQDSAGAETLALTKPLPPDLLLIVFIHGYVNIF